MTDIAKLFGERQAHWTSIGLAGSAVYEALAADPDLPAHFCEKDVAAVFGLSTHAVKMRRARNMKPDFVRISRNCVRYPREAVCRALAQMYTQRGGQANA